MKPINYGKQDINIDDINSVIKVLKSDYLTQGPIIPEFEKDFAKYVGAKYAVAVSNGTAALHLCALSLGLKTDENVITSPITFVASANCIKYCGGNVTFCDIDKKSYLMDLNELEKILRNKNKNFYKGIVIVNFSGLVNDLEKLRNIADNYGLWIIEDACHSPGGYFIDSSGKKQNSGNGNFADLSIFSFHPVKHIATGEGGMITTNNKKLYKKLKLLRSHGITKNDNDFINKTDESLGSNLKINSYPKWYMEMQTLGYNYRLTDFQAALGISQLKRANKSLLLRRRIAKKYFNSFKNNDFIINQSNYFEGHAYHLYVIQVKDRYGLYNFLRSKKIFTQIHYFPCHLMPFYKKLGHKTGDYPESEKYYSNCISLPMYPTLSNKEQNYIIDNINSYTNDCK